MSLENEHNSEHKSDPSVDKDKKILTPEAVRNLEKEGAFVVVLCAKKSSEDEMTSGKYYFSFAFKETISGLKSIDEHELPEKNKNESEDEYLARIIKDPKVIKMAEHAVSDWGNPPVMLFTR